MNDLINNLKNIDINEVAERLGLRPAEAVKSNGKRMFHGPQGKGNTPSLVVNTNVNLFKNFAVNDAGGSNIDLVMHVLNFDFNEAIDWLCQEFSVQKPQKKTHDSNEKPPLHVYIAENCIKNSSDERLKQYLTNRGITENAIERAIRCKTLGFNTYESPTKSPGEKYYGGPAVAFIARSMNPGHIQAVDMRFLDPALNGHVKTQCQGEKKGYFWTDDYRALKKAHTAVIVESCINALTVASAELPGYVGISTLGVEGAREIDWTFLRGKRALICMDKDSPKQELGGNMPGQETAWTLFSLLTNMGIAAFLINQEKWDFDTDLNDLAQKSIEQVKTALTNVESNLIAGVSPGQKQKSRVWLPAVDLKEYWRYVAKPEHTLYLKTVIKTVENSDGSREKVQEEEPVDIAGFRIANLSKIVVSSYVATLKGSADDSPTTFYAVRVQTRKDGNNLIKKVFSEGLFNIKKWEDHFGAVYDQNKFKRLLTIKENEANVDIIEAVNFVGIAWFNGKLRVNQGADCYFPEPDQQCPYNNLKFHSGNRSDAQQVINAYQETFGRNAALMILTWVLGTHLKLFTGYYPHMVISADKGTGKSRLIEKLEVTTGIRKFSSDSLSEFRLRTATSGTSFPIAFDELSNISSKKRTLLESRMQQCYSYDTTKTRTDMLEFVIITPVLVSGEDVDMRNVISKTVCASLKRNMRGQEIDIGTIPKWPMLQWLQFLTKVNRSTFNQALASCKAYCQNMASSRDSTSLRMIDNYALVLLAWKLLCEFTGISEDQGNYVGTLISEMNTHIQQTDSEREPWMWVMEKLCMELQKGTYPYPWTVKSINDSKGIPIQCLIVKLKDIMDYIKNSPEMREFRDSLPISSNNALKAQLKNSGMIFKEVVDPFITNASGESYKYRNCTAISLYGLAQYGIFVPGVDYDNDPMLKDVLSEIEGVEL